MKAGWVVALVIGMALSLSAGTSAAWEYADGVIYASGTSESWHWLNSNGHYAKYQFRGLSTDQQWLLFDILVCTTVVADLEPSSVQTVRLSVRPTGGSWSSREVQLHLRRRDSSEFLYQGQLVLSRRTLGIGTNVDVLLEPTCWRQALGVYEGTVRVLPSTSNSSVTMQPDEETDPIRHAVMVGGMGGDPEHSVTDEQKAVGIHSGQLGLAADEPLTYRLPLSEEQKIWLTVDFTGGGTLELVCPSEDTVAAVEGEGSLSVFYTAHTSGRWSVLLRSKAEDEVRYRLRIEIEG